MAGVKGVLDKLMTHLLLVLGVAIDYYYYYYILVIDY